MSNPVVEKMLKKRIQNLENLLNEMGSRISRLPHDDNAEQLTDLKVFMADKWFCITHQCFDCEDH